ncbi:putative DMT superfamily transporter inner membrane protein [Pseudodesulfovibrio hydrargyri]|uniref:Putative DMT superfamily transporter inner membrane protein n=1 Tax=Pseudodesulfovibrio hydrargyri TaxID=2125990 RepID=A0A1J5MUX8_9BACT|nr:EamA family transporter [Pseudodesulfovibrio hydrargyri]OIQ50421.1 putative DMT superfamily transporter inner membrane protein [Pseudodesulfovibrio hydrargyri]
MPENTAVLARPAAWLAPAWLAAAVLLWGTSFMATKTALTGFGPQTLVWLRMTLAALAVPLFAHRIPRPGYRPGDWKVLGSLCLMQPCLYFLLESNAVNLTTSSQAGMVSSLVPLFVVAGAWAILGEPMTRTAMLGLAVSMAGVIWLSMAGAPDASAPNPALGNLLEVGAMVCAAVYMVVMKRLSTRYSTWWLTGLQCVAGALFFLPGGLAALSDSLFEAPPIAWLAVVYLGLFVTLGAFGLYNMAMTCMPAGRAALSINLVPPVALVAGWLLLGETLTCAQLAACCVVGAGVWLGRR